MLAVYLQQVPDSTIALNLKACNHFRLYNGKAAEVSVGQSSPLFLFKIPYIFLSVLISKVDNGAYLVMCPFRNVTYLSVSLSLTLLSTYVHSGLTIFPVSFWSCVYMYYPMAKIIRSGKAKSSSHLTPVEMSCFQLWCSFEAWLRLLCFFGFMLKFWNVCNSRQSSRTWQTVPHHLLSLARSS